MSYTVHGRLRGKLCDDCDEPLAGVVVRLYSAEIKESETAKADAAQVFDASMIEARAARLLVEATTYPDGTFAATLPEDRYDGGPLDVDVYCRTVPRQTRPGEHHEPVQVHVTTLQPNWTGEPYREVDVDRELPAPIWTRVRASFGAWVICGRVLERENKEPVAGAVVRAFDTDWLQDDPLGAATTDYYGRFRLDYARHDFERTVFSPLVNVELIGGPDLYFRVESYTGSALLNEPRSTGRTLGRENVGPGTCVELHVTGPVPQPRLCKPAWVECRRKEIEKSFEPGRAPIATDGDVFFRPWELLLGPKAVEALRPELEERYGARLFDPDDPDHWPSQHQAKRRERTAAAKWPAPEQPAVEQLPAGERPPAEESPLLLYVLRTDLDPNDMARVVKTLRSRLPATEDDPEYGVHLNHVMFAEPIYQGGPDGDPVPDEAPPPPAPAGLPRRPDIAVFDTGVWAELPDVHGELARRLFPDRDDIDLLDEAADQQLDSCAGHGVFICGLIHRMDAALGVDPGRVLTSVGDGSDESISDELGANVAPVVNLSLGCRTMDDKEPPVLAPRIRNMINNGIVVVAAAGNNPDGGTERPFWPAAMPEVVAVGSWDSTSAESPTRALTSNRGPWVDVYAPGVDLVSSYVPNYGFNGWALWSGTSFATPQIAAEIAIRARAGGTPRRVAADMLDSGKPGSLPDSPWDGNSGRKAKLYPDRGLTG